MLHLRYGGAMTGGIIDGTVPAHGWLERGFARSRIRRSGIGFIALERAGIMVSRA